MIIVGGAGVRREELAGSRPGRADAEPGSVHPKMEEGAPVRDDHSSPFG